MTAIDSLTKFQVDRKLHENEYSWNVEATNIVEELLEALGVNDRNTAILAVGDIQLRADERAKQGLQIAPSVNEQVDAFADVIVFAVGAITKLGYNPEQVLQEVGKEINSRVGKIIDGKFTKDKSPEARAKWYKADFSKCKLSTITPYQREVHYNMTGQMKTDEEIQKWLNELTLGM